MAWNKGLLSFLLFMLKVDTVLVLHQIIFHTYNANKYISKVKHAESEKCFRDICIEDNYTHQFDLANKESDEYRFIWAEFFLTDIKEVTTIDNQSSILHWFLCLCLSRCTWICLCLYPWIYLQGEHRPPPCGLWCCVHLLLEGLKDLVQAPGSSE